MKKPGLGLIGLLGVLTVTAVAQVPLPAPGKGVVTGHVTCGDTGRPARFATVVLFGVPAEVAPAPKIDPSMDQAAMMAALKTQMESMGKTNMVSVQTGMDGNFAAVDVAPGDYFVFGSMPGYVQPRNLVQAAADAGADLRKSIPGAGMVHVTADHAANVDVTMDRGAAISGNVLWDDGTPVPGAMVGVIAPKGDEKKMPAQFGMIAMSSGLSGLMGITDDLGHFRISGLVAGDYLVRATLQTQSAMNLQGGSMNLNRMMAQVPLVIYAPAAFHKTGGKVVTLKAGEDRGDEAITVNLAGMHTVSGRVASAEDHHGLNSGTVRLVDTTDKDFARAAALDAAGNFSVMFVPSGTYDLTVSGGADTEPAVKKDKGEPISFASDHTLRSYEPGKATVIVGDNDVTGQNVELTPSKTVKKDENLEGIFGVTTTN